MEAQGAESAGLATLFWCATKPGRELQIKPELGCQPLVEEEKKPDDKKPAKRRDIPQVKPEQAESAVSSYLKDYRDFLACCANDPDLEQLEELEERASALIKQTVNKMSPVLVLTKGQSLIVPVARARDDLRDLKRRTGRLQKAKDKTEEMDYEQAGRERRKIQDMEDSISRDFVPRRGPSRAATGADIGGSAPTGTNIGKTAPTGTEIGNQPPTLGELIDKPTGIDRNRDNSLTTTKPVTSGRVGLDAGDSTFNTGKVGVDAGDSSFNNNARTGPALGDSSSNR
jgi:hypothetical protein